MAQALIFEPDNALRKDREAVKARILPVKQAIAEGAYKSPVGSFQADLNARRARNQPGPR